MAQVYPIFSDPTGPNGSFLGCLDFRGVFEIVCSGKGSYAQSIRDHLINWPIPSGIYLILEPGKVQATTGMVTTGMVFTIKQDGTLKQGCCFTEETTPIMTRWPPKSS